MILLRKIRNRFFWFIRKNTGIWHSFDMPATKHTSRKYRETCGKELNLKNPQTFNEKLQWLKLYHRKPLFTRMVDKHSVRTYIAGVLVLSV